MLKLPKSKQQHPSMIRSKVQERELAHRVGGRTVIASGALDVKGDVRKKRVMRIEAKTTQAKSFSVTLDMARKIEEAALATNELPVIVVEFNRNGKPIAELCVVPKYVLEMIAEWVEAKT